MAYRRTERVIRRQAERHDAIVAAAGRAASEGGMAAIQIAPVAARAGIAAGTVYRYFPSKTELVGALVASAAEREIAAVRRAAEAAPGPLSALAAAIATFAGARGAQPQACLGDDRRAGRRRYRCDAARLPQGAGRAIRRSGQRGGGRRSSAGASMRRWRRRR